MQTINNPSPSSIVLCPQSAAVTKPTTATNYYYNNHAPSCSCAITTKISGLIVTSLVAICLFVYDWWLIVASSYYYHCISNNQWWSCTKEEEADSLSFCWSTGITDDYFRHNMCVCILYLRCKEAILTIPYKGLATTTTTTIAGKWLIVKYYMTITNDN